MDKTKALLWTIRACGFVSLVIFVLIKGVSINPRYFGTSRLLERMCPQDDWLRYGNLYGQTQIARFRIPLPDEKGPELLNTPAADAGKYHVVVLGDSMAQFRRGHENYVESLSKRLGEPIDFQFWHFLTPECFARLPEPIDKTRPRIVIIERVENKLLEEFADVKACPGGSLNERSTRSLSAFASRLIGIVFTDDELAFRGFFSFSRPTRRLAEALFTARFSLSGAISDQAHLYSLNPPFVFAHYETDPNLSWSFYGRHDDAVIERLADNIAKLRDALRSGPNDEFVFMPVPGKYTLYHSLINNDPYDLFLPRLYDAVERRGIRTVRIYEKLAAEPGLTFYPTDTHWTPLGNEIALDETMKVLRDLRRRPTRPAPATKRG